jgi:AraC-like DNA-binding protein
VARKGSARQVRAALADLAQRAAAAARRFGLKLHSGIGTGSEPAPLYARYQVALSAAEMALSRGESIVYGDPSVVENTGRLWELRRDLSKSLGGRPALLSARFERYVEAVLAHSGYRLESTRAELGAGLERLAEPLLAGGFLDDKGFGELWSALERTVRSVRTVTELVDAYRTSVSEIERMIRRPTDARRGRSMRRARTFIRENLAEALTVDQVARAAGFSPDHFWALFKRTEGTTFARYLQAQRIARAKQMLKDTKLTIEQVQRLSGFQSRATFHRIFRKATSLTPLQYRAGELEAFDP